MAVLNSLLDNAIRSELFTYRDHTFSAEASDLNGHRLDRQIYDDACDIGFAIRSARTDRGIVKFYQSYVSRDADNDIEYWEYKICDDDARKPGCADLRVIIFND